ncbi:AAA family ATPase [Staphylococcus simulans]|uniref:AAA family ATPase n=1 Tax=Staphylococcus simulans TaxID=1286 RepID=UPI000D1DDCB2|nr:AAA family ATPase [Staphylococcus simulans]MDY5059768.1 AAA family ATPase [Staphylococcus simulans]PTJ12724.1 cell division protein FtsH [Staphylococcus simulans]
MGLCYNVGEPRTTFLGKRENWDLQQALEQIEDGDEIEFEQGFCPTEDPLEINKSITISGSLELQENGKRLYTNVLQRIIVRNGATVTLKDIALQTNKEKYNSLNVKEKSTVICHNVYFENVAEVGKNYPIICIEENSSVTLSYCNVKPSKILDGNHRVYCGNSKLKILNSQINALLHLNHTELTCEDSTVEYHELNAMYILNNSSANLTNTTFNGAKITEESNYPSVKVQDSEIVCNKCRVVQPGYSAALYLENSTGKLDSGWYDSIRLDNSNLNVASIGVEESVQCFSKSQINGQKIIIGGRDNGQINFYANQNSVINLNGLYFGRLTTPNIRLERNVEFNVPTIKQLKYNNETNQFVYDENNQYIVTQTLEDIDYFGKIPAYQRLHQLIGIQSVKDEVDEYIAVAEMNKKRQAKGLKSSSSTLHALYLGNPGTGKTTVARIVGELLYEKGIISSDNFIEVSRSDLVAGYIGHTAKQTREVLEKALGGVLFIDEAYTLAKGGEKDFGREAIDEILKFMEDHRSDIVIIFAGYNADMERFLEMNEGLKSRIPNAFQFEDYTVDELVQIGLLGLNGEDYTVDKEAYADLIKNNFPLSDDHSNGRWIRNLNDKLKRKLAVRVSKDPNADITLITSEDLNACRIKGGLMDLQ